MAEQLSLGVVEPTLPRPSNKSFEGLAEAFCGDPPYRAVPFSKRNWGGVLHSLCSYQGKLKPSIAHFLISWFTEPGDIVYDPMAGVGTVPLEARRLSRVGVASDLSPLAYAVSAAKLHRLDEVAVQNAQSELQRVLEKAAPLRKLVEDSDVDWGLNKTIREYFHEDTLREVLAARAYFLAQATPIDSATNLLLACTLHILHGNRPYALSRRSHPVTPLAPTGPYEYRSLLDRLNLRINRVLPELLALSEGALDGAAHVGDFRDAGEHRSDVIITSPPFARSLRFWSSNWMRLWFSGWDASHFRTEPSRYLEMQQRTSYLPYRDLSVACARSLRSGGRLILHLGETAGENMAHKVVPLLEPEFDVRYLGRENVTDTESHGLKDKGATIAHWYLFAERR